MYCVGRKAIVVANLTYHAFEFGTEVILTRQSPMNPLMWKAKGLCDGHMDSWWVLERDIALVEEKADHLELL